MSYGIYIRFTLKKGLHFFSIRSNLYKVEKFNKQYAEVLELADRLD